MAERARAALAPVIPHDAPVIVAPGADGLPVRLAAPDALSEQLAAIDSLSIMATARTAEKGARRFTVSDAIAGLRAAVWVAGSAGVEVALIITARHKLEIGPAEEKAACLIAMLAAARQRGVGQAPSPGTLAFTHAISQERDRLRWELASAQANTLAALLKLLRDAAHGPVRTPAGVAMAIDVASQALLDVKAAAQRQDVSLYLSGADAFTAAETQLREIVRSAGIRLISGFNGDEDAVMPRALGRAARLVSGETWLNATRHAGVDKLRVHWRLAENELELTIAETATGSRPTIPRPRTSRRTSLVASPGWAEAWISTPLRAGARLSPAGCRCGPSPSSPTHRPPRRSPSCGLGNAKVLELMVGGLRNREIAERLFITGAHGEVPCVEHPAQVRGPVSRRGDRGGSQRRHHRALPT